MNDHDTLGSAATCQCAECPVIGCTCGCQSAANHETPSGAPCRCAAGCGCEGAEAGCLCGVNRP